jgi:hypothetical protein
MAKLSKDSMLTGYSGKMGNIVFRRFNRTTLIAAAPRKSNKPPTAGQKLQRDRFRLASLYAKSLLRDPEKSEQYKARAAKGQSAHTVAMQEFLRTTPPRQAFDDDDPA